ncbi:MAG: hypothetical protein ABR498_01095 [Candidatus Dormibacteria bacterium]
MSDATPPTTPERPRWRRRSAVIAGTVVALVCVGGVARATNIGFFGRPSATTTQTPSTSAAPTTSATPSASSTVTIGDLNGDHRNVVIVVNHQTDNFRARGGVKLNEIDSSSTAPVNDAEAFGQCTNCQTIALAIEINIMSNSAHVLVPQNSAIAVNYQCQQCDTIALAYQFNITVPDPHQVPSRVNQLVQDMQRELNVIQQGRTTVQDAVAAIEQVVGQYGDLVQYLERLKKESTAGTDEGATPPPSESAPSSPSASPAASSPTASPTPTPSPSVSASP